MSNERKKWSGNGISPIAPDLALSVYMQWKQDPARRYSSINGYEPNNITAAAAWTLIPNDLIASDAVIYRDKKTNLWVQAVGYPLIPREKTKDWIELQMAHGAVQYWTNQYAQPRLPLKPYTQIETPGKVIDQISYIEMINEQGKFLVNGIDLRDLNPRGRPKDINVHAEPRKRKVYEKRDGTKFVIRKNSKFLTTPKGVYLSVTQAAADMGMTFCGLSYHLKRNTPGYRYITEDEYLIRSAVLNKNEATE
jgi:hypothetical protein